MRVLHNVAGDDIAEAVEDTADQDDRTDRCGVYTDDVRIEEYEEGAENRVHRVAGNFRNAVGDFFS